MRVLCYRERTRKVPHVGARPLSQSAATPQPLKGALRSPSTPLTGCSASFANCYGACADGSERPPSKVSSMADNEPAPGTGAAEAVSPEGTVDPQSDVPADTGDSSTVAPNAEEDAAEPEGLTRDEQEDLVEAEQNRLPSGTRGRILTSPAWYSASIATTS